MPLEQLANLAEVFGMLVVGITLIFLTVQTRQGARATRSAAAIESSSMVTAWYRSVGTSEQTSRLFLEALANPDDRTPEEWLQFVFVFHGLLLAFQNSFYLAREGTLDERINESLTQVVLGVKEQPGFQRYWQQRRSLFFAEFQEHIDAIRASDRRASEGVYPDVSK
jgi:hypothetical protein